jgi:hypothetical protein
MASEGEVELPIFDAMHLDGLIIRTSEQQFSIVAVIEGTDWRVVCLDGKGISLCVIGPNLNSLIFRRTGQLIAQW